MTATRWSKSGQPVLGTILRLPDNNGPDWEGKVVGKMFGRGGNSDLIGIIVEDTDRCRYSFNWPLAQGDRIYTQAEVSW